MSATDEGKVLKRKPRDGNVMKTGCHELDEFIQNLSQFTKRIASMFYNGNNANDNNGERNEKNGDVGDNKVEFSDDNNGGEDSDRDRSEAKEDKNTRTVETTNGEETNDLVHMDLLPIH